MRLLRSDFPSFPPPSVPPGSSDPNDTLVVDYMFKWLYDEGGDSEAQSNVSRVVTEIISENLVHQCTETRNEMSLANSIGIIDPSGNSGVQYITQWIQDQASEFEAGISHENDSRYDPEHNWEEARRSMLQACRSEPNRPSASFPERFEESTRPVDSFKGDIVNYNPRVILTNLEIGGSTDTDVNYDNRVRRSARLMRRLPDTRVNIYGRIDSPNW